MVTDNSIAPNKADIVVQIDWNNDGEWDEVSLTHEVLSFDTQIGGQEYRERMPQEGTATIRLKNSNRDFSPNNPDSPYFGKMVPRRPVRILYEDELLWSGYTDRFQLSAGLRGSREVTIECVQGVFHLKQLTLEWEAMSDVSAQEILEALFTRIAFSSPISGRYFTLGVDELGAGGRELAPDTTLDADISIASPLRYTYVSDEWGRDTSVYDALDDISFHEQCYVYLLRDGSLWIRDRYHFIDQTPITTLTSQSHIYRADISYGEEVYNAVTGKYSPRRIESSALLWERLDESLEAGEVKTIEASIQNRDNEKTLPIEVYPFGNGSVLTATSGGSPLTGVEGQIISEGTTLIITLINRTTSNAIVDIEIKGEAVITNGFEYIQRRDPEAILAYGYIVENEYELPLFTDSEQVRYWLGYELIIASRLTPVIKTIEIIDQKVLQKQLKVGDKITVTEEQNFIEEDMIIIGESHSYRDNHLYSTYNLAPANTAEIFIIGESVLGGEGEALA